MIIFDHFTTPNMSYVAHLEFIIKALRIIVSTLNCSLYVNESEYGTSDGAAQ